jgi:hypothetical protein
MVFGSDRLPPPAQWTQHGDELSPALVEGPRRWLAHAIDDLVSATDDLVRTTFP